MLTLLGDDSHVTTITDSVFKKSQGGAIHLEGGELGMRGTQVSLCKGDNAVRVLGGSKAGMEGC